MTALLVVAAVSCGLQEALNPTATCEGREPANVMVTVV